MKENTATRLKEIMTKKKLRQRDIIELTKPFEKYCGVSLSKSNLSQYLSGIALPSQKKLSLLAMALNVTEPWLMGFDVEMKPPQEINHSKISVSPEERNMLLSFRSLKHSDKNEVLNFLEFKTLKNEIKKDEL